MQQIISVKYIEDFIIEAKKENWIILGTGFKGKDNSNNYIELHKLESQKVINSKSNIILIIGSEGEGINHKILDVCSKIIGISPRLNEELFRKYPFNVIDSLNVSAFLSILIYEMKKQFIIVNTN